MANLPRSYKPAQELLDQLTPFEFSQQMTFYHCSACGSQMIYHSKASGQEQSNGQGGRWNIFTGSLQQAEGILDFKLHEHVADTLDGGFASFLPSIGGTELQRWAHHPEESEQLPLDWHDRPDVTPLQSDRLHCHCKCGGVEFYIVRPSSRSKNAASEWPDVIIPYHSNQPRTDDSAWWLVDDGKKFLGGVCACNSCRLDSGNEWVEWAFLPQVDVSLDAEGEKPYNIPFGASKGWGTLKGYQSSKVAEGAKQDAWRYHCETCGATIFFTCSGRTGLIDIGVGVLDAPEGARAETWLDFWNRRLSYREDAMPRAESITIAVEEGLKKFGERHKA